MNGSSSLATSEDETCSEQSGDSEQSVRIEEQAVDQPQQPSEEGETECPAPPSDPNELQSESTTTIKSPVEFNFLTEAELTIEMNAIINQAVERLHVSPSACKSLLIRFKWDMHVLLERYFANDSLAAFFTSLDLLQPQEGNGSAVASGQCGICLESVSLTSLGCGHQFCDGCCAAYLSSKIKGENCFEIRCPEHSCKFLMSVDTILKLVGDVQVANSFNKLLLRFFVECNKRLKVCPGTDCVHVVKVMEAKPIRVQCECGSDFCFQCSQDWHEPADCVLLRVWLKKCSDDSESSNYIMANTKECPKCRGIIEKNGGCNHMTCKNLSCRNEFCWICLGPWSTHGAAYYNCNLFNDDAAKNARDAQERSRADLARYLHYYNRFANHRNSLRLENKLSAIVSSKVDQMQKRGFSWIETQCLRTAVLGLRASRRVLMFSYTFAYYLEKDNNAIIFEQNQTDLELATEQLSGLLENDMEGMDLVKLRQAVQDKCSYVEKRRQILLKHSVEGHEKNEWIYNKHAPASHQA